MKPRPPVRDIPPERKTLYHAGQAACIAGVLLFLSNFLLLPIGFFGTISGPGSSSPSMAAGLMIGFAGRAVGGIVLMGVGRAMMTVAARGLAGSGLTLDPERARRDLEPWTRMGGGMLSDALDELPASRPVDDRIVEVVRLRCHNCRALNDEAAKFCGQCGGRI